MTTVRAVLAMLTLVGCNGVLSGGVGAGGALAEDEHRRRGAVVTSARHASCVSAVACAGTVAAFSACGAIDRTVQADGGDAPDVMVTANEDASGDAPRVVDARPHPACTEPAPDVATLVTALGFTGPSRFTMIAAGGFVFWREMSFPATPITGRILRARRTGGPPETFVDWGVYVNGPFASDGLELYFQQGQDGAEGSGITHSALLAKAIGPRCVGTACAIGGNDAVRRLPLPPNTTSWGAGAPMTAPAVRGVYWGAGSGMVHWDGTKTTRVDAYAGLVDANRGYWIDSRYGLNNVLSYSLMSMPLSGGAQSKLRELDTDGEFLGQDDDAVYLTPANHLGTGIARLSKVDGALVDIAPSLIGSVSGVVDDGYVYFFRYELDTVINRVPTGGGAIERFVDTKGVWLIRGFATDECGLYWVETTPPNTTYPDRLMRIAKR